LLFSYSNAVFCTLAHVLGQNVLHFLRPLNFVSTSMIRRKLLYIS